MNALRTLMGLITTLIVVTCTATVTAQFIGLGVLGSKGMFTKEKLVRFAGVLYGLDPLDLSPSTNQPEELPEEQTKEEAISELAENTPYIAARAGALRKGTDDIRTVVLGLRTKRESLDSGKKAFNVYLQQLEAENTVAALREIQITLESLPPKQAKDIIYAILTGASDGSNDNAMSDVVSIFKTMPSDKLRKVLGEFKTANERELLHEILVRVGNLDKKDSQLTGIKP